MPSRGFHVHHQDAGPSHPMRRVQHLRAGVGGQIALDWESSLAGRALAMAEPGIRAAIRRFWYRHFTRYCIATTCPRTDGPDGLYAYGHYHLTRPH
jgi:hypothetical protein